MFSHLSGLTNSRGHRWVVFGWMDSEWWFSHLSGIVDSVGFGLTADQQLVGQFELLDEYGVGLCVGVGRNGHLGKVVI